MPDVVLPVLDEREALPWVLERMPARLRADRRRQRLDRRLRASWPRGSARASCASRSAASAPPAGPGWSPRDGRRRLLHGLRRVVRPARAAARRRPGRRRPRRPRARRPRARAGRLAARTRAPPTPLLAWELRRRAGVPLRDLGPMRAARREALLGLGIADRRFGWPLEMVLRAAARRLADRRGHASTTTRAQGRSKVTGTVRGTLRAVRDMAAVLAMSAGAARDRQGAACRAASRRACARRARPRRRRGWRAPRSRTRSPRATRGRRRRAACSCSTASPDGWLPGGWEVVAQRGDGLASGSPPRSPTSAGRRSSSGWTRRR